MSIKTKLLQNLGANAYGQIITVLIQLVSVPFFLSHWGVKLYGEWLVLSAIPSYITLSDVGFASVAANDMTMKFAQNDRGGHLRVYHSIWVFVTAISVLVFCSLLVFSGFADIKSLLSIQQINNADAKLALILLVTGVLVGLQGNVLNAAFRSVGQYAYGTALGNTVRLIEWLGSMIALWLGFGVVGVAFACLLIKTVGTVAMSFALKKEVPWLGLGIKCASLSEIKRLWKPALAFMAFPLGLALSLQGMVLIVGVTLGATAVVIFSTYRTFTRLLVQAVTLLNHSAWPEIAAAYGAKQMDLVRKVHRTFSSFAFWAGLGFVGALMLSGEWFIGIWTKHSFEPDKMLLYFMILNAFINVLWQTSLVVLMATNKLQKISVVFIVSSALSLGAGYLLLPVLGVGFIGVLLALFELPMLYIAISHALKMVGDEWLEYIKSVFLFPVVALRRIV